MATPTTAGWAVIQAVKAVAAANGGKLPDNGRAAVVEALGKVAFDGVTGKVAFDQYGDTTNKQLTVYKVEGGKWVDVKSDTFNQ